MTEMTRIPELICVLEGSQFFSNKLDGGLTIILWCVGFSNSGVKRSMMVLYLLTYLLYFQGCYILTEYQIK